MWTPFFSDKDWTGFYGKIDPSCPYKCKLTTDKQKLNDSQVLMFNIRNLDQKYNGIVFPKHRTENQIWIVHNLEPPYNTYPDPSNFPSVFNWTSFVRPDSDVPSFYYQAMLRSQLRQGQFVIWQNTTLPAYPRELDQKSNFAAWRVSNCMTASNRETYVHELSKHISVDVYGDCWGERCPRSGRTGCGDKVKKHMFYLAFENGLCSGYISEKLWQPMQWGLIPVAMGTPEAYNSAPSGSYIHTGDFKSVRDLAKHMTSVFQNETLYQSYFRWRQEYVIVNDYWCKLCTALHEWDGMKQTYADFGGWFEQDTCQRHSVSFLYLDPS